MTVAESLSNKLKYNMLMNHDAIEVSDRIFEVSIEKSNIQRMIKFYTTYKTVPTLSGQITWSHYCELLSISSKDKRMFYEKECINSNC